jgi:hypothetical protein
MAFDFPASPTTGTLYQPAGGPTYRWNGSVWAVVAAQFQGAMASDVAPANPVPGQLWWESDTGLLFYYFDDGNTKQWVQVSGAPFMDKVYSIPADMWAGFKTSANRFVVNDKVDGTGTDVLAISETGAVTAAGGINATGNIASTGGYVIAGAGRFLSSISTWIGASSGGGDTYLRPAGPDSATGQLWMLAGRTYLNGTGGIVSNSRLQINYDGSNTQDGINLVANAVGAGTVAVRFTYPPAQQTGSITTNTTATAFNTSSDERLKTFTGPLTGDEAAAIIRADPVRHFTWNIDGSEAVGWSAQASYEVSHDLASPPPTVLMALAEGEPHAEPQPGEEGFEPWGMDQAKRTPYLWAALAAALDKIDALEARIAALEAAP